jgi:cyanophycin synthetase
MRAVCQLVDRLDVGGRRIAVLGAPGDRRDEDIRAIADETADHFDCFICKADENRRGRENDEVPRMIQSRLEERGVDSSAIEVIPDEMDAVRAALERAVEGDLVVIFGDDIVRCWKQVIGFDSGQADGAGETDERPVTSYVEEDPAAFRLEPGDELIRDERGVRIARQYDEEGD